MKSAILMFLFLFHFQYSYGFENSSNMTKTDPSKINHESLKSNSELGVEKTKFFLEEQETFLDQKREKKLLMSLSDSKSSKLITILTILLITILSILSLSLYKNNIIRNESHAKLIEKNKELEQAKIKAEDALKVRQEFISTVSHELRTPLNAIHGLTHILLNESPNDSQKRYLEPLMFSSDYLRNLIDDILEINRIEKDKIIVVNQNTSIRKVVSNIFGSFKDSISKNNIKFILEIDPEIPDYCKIDTLKLSQVINNLIHNAVKFTDNGKVSLKLQLIDFKDDFYTILFKVEDTGIGVSEEYQKNIFDNFSQGSKEINRKYGGTGIGLAIVKKLVQVMGGEIKIESELGKGSTFSFELTLQKGEDIAKPNNPILTIDKMIYVNKKILLVEDNKINQMVTKKILEKNQMNVEVTESGEDAILLAKTKDFDLILMDIHLPGINGTEATQQIREFNKQIPIIGLTAISLNENRENLMSYGLNDVITKPFDVDHFYFTMARYLKE